MAGIAGIAQPGQEVAVREMLEKIAHRGPIIKVFDTGRVTLGAVWQPGRIPALLQQTEAVVVQDITGIGHFAQAVAGEGLLLRRDPLGVVPLYYGETAEGSVCFASEVKGLLGLTRVVHELPPGHTWDGQNLQAYTRLEKLPAFSDPPEAIATELRRRLDTAVTSCTSSAAAAGASIGSWLSGGLDSSLLAALAARQVQPFHTFTAGLPGAPDVVNAQDVADFIHSQHHVLTVHIEDLLDVLPQVIYHLESFDAWLVRSSIMNYLVAQLASDYVQTVLSGEGGDELFAGYAYLKTLKRADLADELIDLTARLHNTALQRVDRSASAHETQAYTPFLQPEVVNYALRIPTEYKLCDGVEKWILRQAAKDLLPEAIVNRPKAKFWEGAGVEDLLAQTAERLVSDSDFALQRILANGWQLNTKEELLYYRIFKEQFGEMEDLDWMGRTKGSPVA